MSEFYDHFMEMATDPAHLAFEVFTMVLLDLLILGLIWPLIVRRIRREHNAIDAEHGVDHHGWFFADLNVDPDLPIADTARIVYNPRHRGVPSG